MWLSAGLALVLLPAPEARAHDIPPDVTVQAFIKTYSARFKNADGSAKIPDAMAILGYDSLRVMADAIKRAGKADSKAVRDALGIHEGDEVIFRVEGHRAVLSRTPEFLALAGTIGVPAAKRNVAWDDVIRRTRSDRAAARR